MPTICFLIEFVNDAYKLSLGVTPY